MPTNSTVDTAHPTICWHFKQEPVDTNGFCKATLPPTRDQTTVGLRSIHGLSNLSTLTLCMERR